MSTVIRRVIRVEMREEKLELVQKHKRHDYKLGGYRIEETIWRRVVCLPVAILECGHETRKYNAKKPLSEFKKMGCWVCNE